MVTFLHTADWQLGMKGSGLGEAAELVSAGRIDGVGRILEIASEAGADFVLAAGDLFESNQIGPAIVEGLVRVLRAHPGVEIHAIPGNHDAAGPDSVWNRPLIKGVPHLKCHLEAGAVDLPGTGAVLHPCPVTTRFSTRDPLADLEDLAGRPGVHIALAHGHLATETFGAREDEIHLPLDPAHVARAGLDYLALGHWHGTRIVEASDGVPRIAYAGTHERTSFEEKDAGNVLIVEIEEKGAPPRIRKRPVGRVAWADLSLRFEGDENLHRLRSLLEETEADLLRVRLEGALPAGLTAAYRQLEENARGKFAHVRFDDDDLAWLAAPGEDFAIADAGLAKVRDALLDGLAGAGEEEAAARREALSIFKRTLREEGL